ncbi:phosphate ABC transporter permease PstA [Cellulomonas sp. P24]|uniref:phosphate ABC transporter permease PstA n=1 Tax=Cellulomonas sp. P24 TaxID=2885206 RepID=UPI00216AE42F|nr:phosphate ABC transporter permease PstA [Cellulomonas sp. P24]MCR6493094.1 phosphate ABC transporter permease PstA [Cellulomonas sp. P24]
MTTAPTAPAPAPADVLVSVSGGNALPCWTAAAVAGATLVVSGVLFALTPLQGVADFVVFSTLLFVVAFITTSVVVEGGRRARDRLALTLTSAALVMAVVPLVAVLGFTLSRGLARFDGTFFTHSMFSVADSDPGGGIYHAIVGTIEQVGIATVISVPLGLMVSIYLVEYARGRFGRVVSTFVDVMTGLPSIVAGLFVLALWVLILHQGYSGFAGSLALVILMIPVVVRTTEEMLRLVPDSLREASYALGIPRWQTIRSIVLPTAMPGITTGIMLAVARVSGETAPLLLTVFGSTAINVNPFSGPQEALPLFVFSEAGLPNDTALARAWAGALTLILLVVLLNVVARLLVRRSVLQR